MEDFKELFKSNYLQYASYVILDRAIPNVIDGLKPVQRRILHTLHSIDDGKFHKVANVAGQTMAYHPHGDAPINESLVNLANKGYLLDTQGNFGNTITGDPPAASRYIETRLSPLARETLFNPALTHYIPSYDGRRQEPVALPAKIPVLLMQGAEGIAVGMSTRILPHNFIELLNAQIAILEERRFRLLPDFPTGGILDATDYDKGRGKVKLRAKLIERDDKTIVIKEVCYGTTTESLIQSIDEAAKKGKIKIDSIDDYTAETVEIEIKLPRGQHAKELIDALYAYTECEVTLHSQVLVIKDNLPWQTDVEEVLRYHLDNLQIYLRRELEIEEERLKQKIFEKTLERIFIEHRLYKKIEEVRTYEKIHETIAESLQPFHKKLSRIPEETDREKLLSMPLRRISRFDLDNNETEIKAMEEKLEEVQKNLKRIKAVTIRYLKGLLEKYGELFPRRTKIGTLSEVDVKAMETRQIKIGFDKQNGFLGTKVEADMTLECTNFDKLLLLFKDGTYKVISIPEKQYVHQDQNKVVFVGVADKKTVIQVVYRDSKTHLPYAKRFIVDKFILDKVYRYLDESKTLDFISITPGAVAELTFKPAPKQRISELEVPLEDLPLKGVSAKGIRLANKPVTKVKYLRRQIVSDKS